MKMYLIAIIVAVIGLWLSGEVRADGLCGERSSTVFSVEDWAAKPAADNEIDYTIKVKSNEDKAIKAIGGTIEFFTGKKSIAGTRIILHQPVAAHGEAALDLGGPDDKNDDRLLRIAKTKIRALACVDHIDYADGSGVIIN
jgi:hypothetical protein